MITIPVMVKVRDWQYHGTPATGASGHPYTDLTPYIKLGGLKWSRNDVEHSSAGRDTQDGLMHRARVGLKVRLDCQCRPITSDEAKIVLKAIEPVWLDVVYLDPQEGAVRGGVDDPVQMYSNNIPATFLFMRTDGTSYWEGIEFPLIER